MDCSDRVMEEYSLSNEEEETDSENEVAQLPVSERKFIVYGPTTGPTALLLLVSMV